MQKNNGKLPVFFDAIAFDGTQTTYRVYSSNSVQSNFRFQNKIKHKLQFALNMRKALAMVRFKNLFLLYAATALTWKPALLSFIDAIFIHVLNRGSYLK